MEWLAAIATYGVSLIAAVLVGPSSRYRSALAWPAAAGAMSCALLLPADEPLVRFLLAVSGFALLMRIFDLRLDPRAWSLRERLWLCTAVVDVRAIQPTPRKVNLRRLSNVLAYAGLAALGWVMATAATGADGGPAFWGPRWVGGAILIYGIADAVCGLAVFVYELAGFRIPPQHHAPILATSVAAFWSRHYNRNVSAWLGRHFQRPLAGRGYPNAGMLLAFAASAAVHAWITWVALDLTMAGLMGAFFVVQGLLVALERSIRRFAYFPTTARRVWTIGAMALTSPLFVEPFLRILRA